MRNKIFFFIICMGIITSCTKMDHTYKPYLKDGEIIYPGVPTDIVLNPGRNRVEIQFPKNLDPNVTGYIIFWNDKVDSVIIEQPKDSKSIKAIISGLNEQTYNFEIVSFDKFKNYSLEVLKSGKSYGAVYESNLFTRTVVFNNTLAGLKLDFASAELFNQATEVTYLSTSGVLKTVSVPSTEDSYLIADNQGSVIKMRSSFIPSQGIDVFYSPLEEKTFNPYSGVYKATGVFHHPNGDRNIDMDKTLVRITDEVVECDLGDLGSSNYRMKLKVNADFTVTITPAGVTPDIDQHWGPNYYDPATKTFHLFYSYNITQPRKVEETFVLK